MTDGCWVLYFNLLKVPGAWSLLSAEEAERRGGSFAMVVLKNLKEQKTLNMENRK